MLWRIEFEDKSTGWCEVGSGRLFDEKGAVLTGAYGYTPTDTSPTQPEWYVEPAPWMPPPPVVPRWDDPNLDPQYRWIDVGPFFDRFGAKALTITSSTDPVVQGLVTLILPRLYVDLTRSDLPQMVGLLALKGLIKPEDMAVVLNHVTTEQERHVKGLPQPE